jgi:hypothetical protein
VQGGIARSIAALDEPGVPLTARVTLPVIVRVHVSQILCEEIPDVMRRVR